MLLAGNVDLNQHFHGLRAPQVGRSLVDLFGQAKVVDRMNQPARSAHRLDLVALQAANEVPADGFLTGPNQSVTLLPIGHRFRMGFHDLQPVFAQIAVAEVQQFADLVVGGELGHRHQADIAARAAIFGCRSFNSIVQSPVTF